MEIILGSKSPRRKELLAQLGFTFEILAIEVDESYDSGIEKREVARFIAEKKVDAMQNHMKSNQLLICADTIVLLENIILEKPKNKDEAIKMLQTLSGKWHEVITGVALFYNDKKTTFSVSTKVKFSELSLGEITNYINQYQPYDKAGSYGIQESIGAMGISEIIGSYNNVVGLPTHELYHAIKTIKEED